MTTKIKKTVALSFTVSLEEDIEFTADEWQKIETHLEECHFGIRRYFNNGKGLVSNPIFDMIVDKINSKPLDFIDDIDFEIIEDDDRD